MSSDAVAARKGRLKQRYDNEFRLVAGSAPSILCLLISSLALGLVHCICMHAVD
jgi:hypothetical protein